MCNRDSSSVPEGEREPAESRAKLLQDLEPHYRRYAWLLLERERVRRLADGRSQVEATLWHRRAAPVGRQGAAPEGVCVPDDGPPGGEAVEQKQEAVPSAHWGVLQQLAIWERVSEETLPGLVELRKFVEQHPLGEGEGTTEVDCSAYLAVLATAMELEADAIAELTREAGLSLPWGEGGWRVPESAEEFESICRLLRDRDPDMERGCARILSGTELPPARTGPDAASSRPRAGEGITENVWIQEGDRWKVVWDDKSVYLKDTDGAHYIAELLASPRKKQPAVALYTRLKAPSTAERSRADEVLADGRFSKEGKVSQLGASAGSDTIFDRETYQKIAKRLREIDEELDAAERDNDSARTEKLQEEKAFLAAEVEKALGLGGKLRTFADATHRHAQNVSKAIHLVLKKLADCHPSLHKHLEQSLKTGSTLKYTPPKQTRWRL